MHIAKVSASDRRIVDPDQQIGHQLEFRARAEFADILAATLEGAQTSRASS
jgi:hypothetical protein